MRNCEECGWPEPCDCEPERSAGSLARVVRRWQWSWHRCKPFQVRVTWWGDKRITVQKGFHVWVGWWRLSAVYLEMEAPNGELSDRTPKT